MSAFEQTVVDLASNLPKEGEVTALPGVDHLYLQGLDYAREHHLTVVTSSSDTLTLVRVEVPGTGERHDGEVNHAQPIFRGSEFSLNYGTLLAFYKYFQAQGRA